jgi:hypothetical protein
LFQSVVRAGESRANLRGQTHPLNRSVGVEEKRLPFYLHLVFTS